MQKDVPGTSLLILAALATCAASISGCIVTPQYQAAPVSPPMEQVSYAADVAPPPLQFAAPPDIVVVPSGDISVYMVPNMAGVYFYEGMWYRNYAGYWYQAPDYNAVWVAIGAAIVPQVIINVPPEYPVYLPADYQRVHYREFHDSWRTWDHERHWQQQEWYRRESLAETRRERMNRIERDRASKPPEKVHRDKQRQQEPLQKQKEPQLKPDMPKPQLKPELQQPQLKPELQQPLLKPDMPKPLLKPDMPKPQLKPDMPKPQLKPDMPKPQLKPELQKPQLKPELQKPQLKPELQKPQLKPKPDLPDQKQKPDLQKKDDKKNEDSR
jgi:hypothetical protein